MNFLKKTAAFGLLAMGVVGLSTATVACSDDETTPVPVVTSDAGDGGAKKDLYTKLGGDPGVDAALAAIIGAELMDANIRSYFFAQQAMPTPAGSPTVSQLSLCFRHLIKRNTTDPKIDDYAVTSKNGGFACRDMKTAHASLHISAGDFDKFVATVGSTLTGIIASQHLNVSAQEGAAMVTLLNGTKTDVVDSLRAADASGFPSAPTSDGGDGGH